MAEGQNNDRGFGRLLTKNDDGNTPLHTAALTGNADLIRELLEGGSEDLEERNALGQTPLYLAVISGNDEAVKRLLEAGADLTVTPEDGTTIWHAAALAGEKNIIRLLTVSTKVAPKRNATDKAEATDFINSKRGEFETVFARDTTDQNKLENENTIVEQTGPTSFNHTKNNDQIKDNVEETLRNSKLSKNFSGKSEKPEEFSEKRTPSEETFNPFADDVFHPSLNKNDFVESTKNKDAENKNSDELQGSKFENSHCISMEDISKKNAEEQLINVCPGKDEKEIDNTNSTIDSNEILSKSKNERERRRMRNLLNRINGSSQQGNVTTGRESECDDSTIYLDLTRSGSPVSSDREPGSTSQANFMLNSQRKNKNRRRAYQRNQSTVMENGKRKRKMDCITVMDEIHSFVRNKLRLMERVLGRTKNKGAVTERIYSCMREYFATHMEKNVDVHSTDGDGRTILHHASVAGAVGTVEKLVRAGSNVNLPDREMVTPMLLAALGGSPEVVGILAESGGKFDSSCTVTGESPLHAAARHDHHRTVKKLLELGAHPNVGDLANRTPLQLALSKGYTNTCWVLMKHGASLQPKNLPRL